MNELKTTKSIDQKKREFFGSTKAIIKHDMINRRNITDPKRKFRNELRDRFSGLLIYERAVLTLLVYGDENHERFIRENAGISSSLLETINYMSSLEPSLFRYSFEKARLGFNQAEQIVSEKAKFYNNEFDKLSKGEYAFIGALYGADKKLQDEILSSPKITARQFELWEKFQKLPDWIIKQIKEIEAPVWGGGARSYLVRKGYIEAPIDKEALKKAQIGIAKRKALSSIKPDYQRGIVKAAEFGTKPDALYRMNEQAEWKYLLEQERKDEQAWKFMQINEGIFDEKERTTLYKHNNPETVKD